MSLLQTITKASSTTVDQDSNYPIVLNPVFTTLKPKIHDPPTQTHPVTQLTGWEISQTDTTLIELGQNLINNLKNTETVTKPLFLQFLSSFLEKVGESIGILAEVDKFDEGYVCNLVEKLGVFIGKDCKKVITEGCVNFECWDVLQVLISNGIVERSFTSNLVQGLIDKFKSDLIVLCVMQLMDFQAYDLLCVLRYFLVTPGEGYKSLGMVREAWEAEGLLAIEKASGIGVSGTEKRLAKEAAVLVMMAHDGFSVSELCLHYLIASKNLDEVIFSACVGKLNGEELKALVTYLGKWIRKYDRFPQAGSCSKGSSVLGLTVCDWIPSLEDVVKCFGIVVDENFSSLVLDKEFHEEIRALEGIVNLLAVEVRLCGTLTNLADRLKTERNDRCT